MKKSKKNYQANKTFKSLSDKIFHHGDLIGQSDFDSMTEYEKSFCSEYEGFTLKRYSGISSEIPETTEHLESDTLNISDFESIKVKPQNTSTFIKF